MTRVIICGAGLAGSLAALAIARRRPDIELLVIDQNAVIGGNHIWSFFDTDVPESGRWLVDQVARRRWPDHEVSFPARSRVIPVGYNSIVSSDLDAALRTTLGSDQLKLGVAVDGIGPDHVVAGSERIEADCVLDARGAGAMSNLDLGWQKFVGGIFRFEQAHHLTRPMIMDAKVTQTDGFRFLYLLPMSASSLLIEDTYYASSPILDCNEIELRLAGFAASIGRGEGRLIGQESGVLPVVLRGKLDDLWPRSDAIARLGMRGGFFHPTTGYSLADAVANAVLLTQQRSWHPASIASVVRGRAKQLWRERRFFQLLNRMLFRAAEPTQRYRVLEHFYRLPQSTITRFYAASLTPLDKLRIVSGTPPVPVGRAFAALRGRVA